MRGKLANVGGKLPSQREENQSKPATMGLSQRNGVVKHESKVRDFQILINVKTFHSLKLLAIRLTLILSLNLLKTWFWVIYK